METAVVILSVGLLVFLAHFFTALFNRTRIPDVLPLLVLGVLLGPLLHIVTPEAFGKVGGVFTVVALVVILFQSGLGLRLSDLWKSLGGGLGLTLMGYFLTIAVVAGLGRAFLSLTWIESLILGSVLAGTSSAVVIPIIEKIRLGEGAKTSLLLESTFSDVLCIVGTLGLLHSTKQEDLQLGAMAWGIFAAFLFAALIGSSGAFLWSLVLGKVRRLENSTFLTPAFVFVVYGAVELWGYSGAIAALAFGIVLGNIQDLPGLNRLESVKPVQLNPMEKDFFSEVVFLLKTFFFVYIGLSLKFDDLVLLWGGLALTAILFLLRIVIVRLSFSKKASVWDASVAAVMNPKGLAAAVLAGLPLKWGLEGGETIQSAVYSVVLFSILATALLVFLLNRPWLKGVYGAIFKSWSPDTTTNKD